MNILYFIFIYLYICICICIYRWIEIVITEYNCMLLCCDILIYPENDWIRRGCVGESGDGLASGTQ